MGEVIVSTSKLKALADVIRLKSGKSELMTLDSMPRRIRLLPGRISNTINVSDLCRSGTPYAPNVKLRAIPLLKTTGMTDMSSMFKDLNAASTVTATAANYIIDVSSLNTASVTNMSSMFEGAKGDVEGIHVWDTSNVTNMSSMFKNFTVHNRANDYVRTIDLSDLDVSNVTDFSYMFSGFTFQFVVPDSLPCSYLDLNNFDTSSATTMEGMFNRFDAYDLDNYHIYLWVPSTFVSTQISSSSLKPFYYGPSNKHSLSKLHVYTDATDAVSQGWGTIHSGFDMHYNSTHSDFLALVNS